MPPKKVARRSKSAVSQKTATKSKPRTRSTSKSMRTQTELKGVHHVTDDRVSTPVTTRSRTVPIQTNIQSVEMPREELRSLLSEHEIEDGPIVNVVVGTAKKKPVKRKASKRNHNETVHLANDEPARRSRRLASKNQINYNEREVTESKKTNKKTSQEKTLVKKTPPKKAPAKKSPPKKALIKKQSKVNLDDTVDRLWNDIDWGESPMRVARKKTKKNKPLIRKKLDFGAPAAAEVEIQTENQAGQDRLLTPIQVPNDIPLEEVEEANYHAPDILNVDERFVTRRRNDNGKKGKKSKNVRLLSYISEENDEHEE